MLMLTYWQPRLLQLAHLHSDSQLESGTYPGMAQFFGKGIGILRFLDLTKQGEN